MKLLPRLRYILEVMTPPPPVVDMILRILTRISRHSLQAASEVTPTVTHCRQPLTVIADLLYVVTEWLDLICLCNTLVFYRSTIVLV